MAYVSSLVVSSTSSLLSSLRSFVVSTLGWTLLDTGVSGLAENFVARSSGVSGDRRIIAKFGISAAGDAALSCFVCDGFASGTDVTSNVTTEKSLAMNSGGSITAWFTGDLDHVMVATNKTATTTVPVLLYVGLTEEFAPTVAETPNQTIIANGMDFQAATGRVVEGPTNTFNGTLNLRSLVSGVLNKSDPNQLDGLVYFFPIVVDLAWQVAVRMA